MCESEAEMNYPFPKDGIFTRIERVFHPKSRAVAGCFSALPTGLPFQVGYYHNAQFARRLAQLLPFHDLALAHLIRTGSYLARHNVPKILEMTDAISLTYQRGGGINVYKGLRSVAFRWEARRLLKYERSIVDRFDSCILVSEVDRDFLFPHKTNQRIRICPNGVETDSLPYQYAPDGHTIVFIGNNTAMHNADGIVYFARNVLPKVRERFPNAVFKVVGRIKAKLKRSLENQPGVTVTGTVASIPEAAHGASVAVCPIRFGAGVQNKLLEYFSLGIPSISSPIGLEGLLAVPGTHLLLANSIDEWSSAVCDLLTHPEKGRALSLNARQLTEIEYSWSSMLEPLHADIRELLGKK
jgi:glycosyltransferase involved in cell wall biosynthesis